MVEENPVLMNPFTTTDSTIQGPPSSQEQDRLYHLAIIESALLIAKEEDDDDDTIMDSSDLQGNNVVGFRGRKQ